MDHVPYPSSSQLPPIEVPFLCKTERDSSNEKTDRSCNIGDGDGASAVDRIWTEVKSGNTTSAVGPYRETNTSNPPPFGSGLPDHSTCTTTSDWTIDFWKYPEQQGWCANSDGSWLTSSPEQTAGRAQEWLYLELLRRFIGQQIEINSLARQSRRGEPKVLDSSLLPDLLIQWATRESRSDVGRQIYIGAIYEKTGKQSPVLSLLAQVAAECGRLDDIQEPCQSTSLAIRILVDTLANAVHNLMPDLAAAPRIVSKLASNPLTRKRLLSNGWCPRQIALLSDTYSPTTVYYISSLPRPPTFGGVRHGDCNENRCQSASVDPATYEPRHADDCSTMSNPCRMFGVQSSQVADCIKRGHIPLIKISDSIDGTLQLEIIESRSDLRYVAFSHVWSGGLGNVKANSMLCCQLQIMRRLLDGLRKSADDDLDRNLGTRKFQDFGQILKETFGFKVPEQPLLFWMDTLCVPVGAENAEMRQAAIESMAQIYVEAQCVLVIDPELQKINHKGLSDEQVFANVLISAWNSRCWTLQEACMARVFYVQFADGHCVIDKKWHDFMKRREETSDGDNAPSDGGQQLLQLRDSLFVEVSDWFREMPVMTKIRGYDTRTLMTKSEDWQNFVRVWNCLRTRSSTKTDDLYGIVAIMVDLSAHEILRLNPRERMKAILRSQSTLPIPLLYQDCARVSDSDGVPLWAPSQIAAGQLQMNGGYMSVLDDGLLLAPHKSDQSAASQHAWPVAYIFSTAGPLLSSFVLRLTPTHLTFSVRLCFVTREMETSRSWLILCPDLPGHDQVTQTISGALLSVRNLQGSTVVTQYCCPLIISLNPPQDDQSIDTPKLASVEVQATSRADTLIKIQTDLTSWYKPKLRISKSLCSTRIIIRNFSNMFEFGAITLTSVLYMMAIIGCAVHHQNSIVRKIIYLLVARYVSHFPELYWAGIVLIHWDRERMSRWSTRLYGEVKASMWQRVSQVLFNVHVITKAIPLTIGSVSFGLYGAYHWPWAKWFGVIMFTEIGVRLAYTWIITLSTYPNIGKIGRVTREDISDLPEDMTNFSRLWRERNQDSWWDKERQMRKRPIA